ncbi:PPE domain-containing protein [Nocardia jiangsuensis]|uniref:PPE domain-containing protein n=1 Tax=Nocardia jiangsuensis TaxID=1691563 RepID=A0ABV8DW67_9NOCA
MTYDDYRARIIDAQEQWNRERDTIYDFTARANTGFTGEYDPPNIPAPDNYDSMTLTQMVDAVNDMRPSVAQQAAEAWTGIGMNLTGAVSVFNEEFARTVQGGWQGAAAQSAVTAVQNYTRRSEDLATAAAMVGLKLAELHTGLHQTQALMPYVTERPDVAGKTLPQEGVMKAGDYAEEEATQEARRVLRTVYGQVAQQTDHGVPVLPDAPVIVNGPGSDGPPASTQGTPTSTNSTGPAGTDTPTIEEEPVADVPATDTPTTDAGTPTEDHSDSEPQTEAAGTESTTQSTTPTSTTPSTTPASTTPSPTSTVPGPPSTTPGTPSSPGTPSRPGTPSPGTPSGTPATTPAPGRSIAGTPPTTTVTPATTTATTTSTRSTTGTPGMMGGGAGAGRRDDENSAGTKDYLVNQRNGEELTGLDALPRTVPPVIGGDNA